MDIVEKGYEWLIRSAINAQHTDPAYAAVMLCGHLAMTAKMMACDRRLGLWRIRPMYSHCLITVHSIQNILGIQVRKSLRVIKQHDN